MSNQGSVELFQSAWNGVGWEGILQEKNVLKNLNKAKNLPGERSSLHIACIRGNTELTERLLQNDADPNIVDKMGESPLHKAASNGHSECARALLAHGANIDQQNLKGDTALHRAVITGQEECLEVLLENEAQVNFANFSGDTPLHLASQGLNLTCVRELLSHKANINQLNDHGMTAMDLAIENNHPPITLMLTMYGAKQACALRKAMPKTAIRIQELPPIVYADNPPPQRYDQSSWPALPTRQADKGPKDKKDDLDSQTERQRPPMELSKLENFLVKAEKEAAQNTISGKKFSLARPKRDQHIKQDQGSDTKLELGIGIKAVVEIDPDSLTYDDTSYKYGEENVEIEDKVIQSYDQRNMPPMKPPVDVIQEVIGFQGNSLYKPKEEVKEEAITMAPEKAGVLTKYLWQGVNVQLIVPRLSRNICIDLQPDKSNDAKWDLVSVVYSLHPPNIQSKKPLLLTVPVPSRQRGTELELLWSSTTGDERTWLQANEEAVEKLAWFIHDKNCHIYVWQFGAFCLAQTKQHQQDEGLPKEKKIKRDSAGVSTEMKESREVSQVAEVNEAPCIMGDQLTRQVQNEDIFSAALKSLLGDINKPAGDIDCDSSDEDETNAGPEIQAASDTDQDKPNSQDKPDFDSMPSGDKEVTAVKEKAEPSIDKKPYTEVTGQQEPIQTASQGPENVEQAHHVLYLDPPNQGSVPLPSHAIVAEREPLDIEFDFLYSLKKSASEIVEGNTMVRRSLEKLGMKATENVDTWTLLKLWQIGHHQLKSREIWRPLVEILQELDVDIAEEFIQHYEVHHLKKGSLKSNISEEQAQQLCQNLYAANCLPDKLKKQLKKLDNSKKVGHILEHFVFNGDSGSKNMSDFKKALYRTSRDLVEHFSLL